MNENPNPCAVLILCNGQRIKLEGVSPEYLATLLSFKCFAGYILKPALPWLVLRV